jgi:hypothetical protein
MRNINTVTVLVVANLMASAVVRASEPSLPWQASGSQGVAAIATARHAAPDWTAIIGTGEAAAAEAGVARSNDVPPAGERSYPNPDWTAAIGRGTAAARPIS